MTKYGQFNERGDEYTITSPATPRSFDNFLFNKAVMSNVEQTGVGYMDYQIGELEAVQLMTGNGRVCDFDVFGRDSLMSRLIYVKDNKTGEFFNVNWEPAVKAYDSYACTHGLGYTIIKMETKGLVCTYKILVPEGNDPVELWDFSIENLTGEKRDLTVFFYNQLQFRYKWGFDSYGDMLFRSSYYDGALNAFIAIKNPHIRPHAYLTAYLTADTPIDGFDGVRDAFVGRYGNLAAPIVVVEGNCTNTPGSSDATIGAVQFNISLESGGRKDISLLLGVVDDTAYVCGFKEKYLGQFDKYFDKLKEAKQQTLGKSLVKTPDAHFDRLLNYWVKQQTMFGAAWCRWGWMGYRDIVQHGLGVTELMPERTREIILTALQYQYSDGRAVRGWNPLDTKPYSDSALWLVFTLVEYIKETDDTKILDEMVPFLDEPAASVKAHMMQALDFLESHKGRNGLVLIKFGDWNDSLTAVGKDGKGESVWLSQAYGEALLQMSELFAYIGDEAVSAEYLQRYESIKKAINQNAWDGNWYARCFDDNGSPIGSNKNEEGKIFMEAQAWALIAGIADEKRANALINSCDEMLKTMQGYKLLAPTFTKRDDSIGRISCMEPGICENGTIYSHVNIWMVLGLLKTGRADKAYEAFKAVSPGYFASESDKKMSCPPYIYSNCYYGPDHKNNALQMEFAWVTGSCAWFNHVLSRYMLGVKPSFKGLEINPNIPAHWDGFEMTRQYKGATYLIKVSNPNRVNSGALTITVDGVPIEGNIVPAFGDGKEHVVDVHVNRSC